MRIAFDVYGTLLGEYEDKVLHLYKELEARGHQMIVWSSLPSYVHDAIEKHKLHKAIPSAKIHKDLDDENFMVDYAIDDEKQHFLSAKNIILVKDIPEDKIKFNEFLNIFNIS